MERSHTPAPGLISSLEAMIDVAVSSAIDRRLGPERDTLSGQVDSAVNSALDRRLGAANTDLNNYINSSVDTAIRERFGPAGSALSAQITFNSPRAAAHHEARTSREGGIGSIVEGESSSARRYKSPSQNVQYQHITESRRSRQGSPDDDEEAFTARVNSFQHDSSALQEHRVYTTTTDPYREQPRLVASFTTATGGNQAGRGVKLENYMLGDQVLRNGSSARQASSTQENVFQHALESSRLPSRQQSDTLEDSQEASKVSINENDGAEVPPPVRSEGFEDTGVHKPREREAGQITNAISQPHAEQHDGSLPEERSVIYGDKTTLGNGTTSDRYEDPERTERAEGLIPLTRPRTDTTATGGLLPKNPGSTLKGGPRPDLALVGGNTKKYIGSEIEHGHGPSTATQNEGPSRQNGLAKTNPFQEQSTPTVSSRAGSSNEEESLFVGNGGYASTPTVDATLKRKASVLKDTPQTPGGSDGEKGSAQKKRPNTNPPGYTDGPVVQFRKDCGQSTATRGRRGYPRVVDLGSFTLDSNKQYFTMADAVATILWHHGSDTYAAFFDIENRPTFKFVRKENDKRRRNFVIERKEKDTFTQCLVGYHAKSPGHEWHEYYEYSIGLCGRWDPIQHQTGARSRVNNKKQVQEEAVEFGVEVLLRHPVWRLGDGVEIIVNGKAV